LKRLGLKQKDRPKLRDKELLKKKENKKKLKN
jgi:hypothetical protein